MSQEISYADADGVQIAYQMWGTGENVLVCVPGLISNIELNLENVEYSGWLKLLSNRLRVIVFDKRGQGLSDRVADAPGPEQRMDDITAIAKAENLQSFSLFGQSEGASTALLYAATFPGKVKKVCVFGGFARFSNCADYDHMFDEKVIRKSIKYWGTGASGFTFFPDEMPERRDKMARFERACCTPNGYQALLETNFQIDIRSILKEVKVPALVMHRRDDKAVPVGNGRYLADHLTNADYIEFASGGHLCWLGDQAAVAAEMLGFLLSSSDLKPSPISFLATVLFTDIVDSSAKLASMGDLRWRELLDAHDQRANTIIEKWGGNFIKSTGDGLLATFDGPGRAVRCALELQATVTDLGIDIRSGLHIGEVQPRGNDIAGLAVHVAARVVDKAKSREVMISRTLNDLLAGSGLKSQLVGEYDLKGLPGTWPLYTIA
jgi:pimeloyl-ACP methyl ester carboxylesterase